jgi:RNA polymerase sigma-70 factor (ECF subfamily)
MVMKCNTEKFSRLYETIYRDLFRFAVYMMHHTQDAEDAVSEAVILAYENIHQLRDECAFKSWMFTILSNVCKRKLGNAGDLVSKEDSIEVYQSAFQSDLALNMDVRKAFLRLSLEERTIVALSVFGGYNSSEIGKTLELNANTVRSKRSRALGKMSVLLQV